MNRGLSLQGSLAVEQLPQLGALVEGIVGDIEAKVAFDTDAEGRARVRLTARAVVELACQHCLGSFVRHLACDYAGIVTETRAKFEAAGQADEVILGEGFELDIAKLIEDELILALPMVPRHAGGDCAPDTMADDRPERAGSEADPAAKQGRLETWRPFAGLGEQFASNRNTQPEKE